MTDPLVEIAGTVNLSDPSPFLKESAMSHVPLIDPELSTGRAKEIFAGPLKGQAFNLFKAMANALAGLSEADTIAARVSTPADARLAAIVKFTRLIQQHRGELSTSDVAAFRAAGFDDAAIVEVFGHIAAHNMNNYFNNFNQTALDVPPLPRA